MKFTKLNCDRANLDAYFEQRNVIRRTALASSEMNYGKIAVFSDSDVDGAHVLGLLLNFFSMWPELFHGGRIYRLTAPLYYCVKGSDTKVFYTNEEYVAANLKGYEISYFKGLGSMPVEVYDQCINNPRLVKISLDDAAKLEMAFGDSAEARKDWLLK